MLLQEVPETLAIVGAGAVGVEFAYLYNTFGSRVTLVEMLPQVLPVEDHEISAALQNSLTRQGIEVLVESRVDGVETGGDGLRLQVTTPQGAKTVQAAKVLVAIGVQGNVETLGLESAGVTVERGFVPVDAHCRTNVPGNLRHRRSQRPAVSCPRGFSGGHRGGGSDCRPGSSRGQL